MKKQWKSYAFEFFSIFVAVISAFALNNWNDNRRDRLSETKILTEISNGLQKDLEDMAINIGGHEAGLRACAFWRQIVTQDSVSSDSISKHYLNLTRDFFSVQNASGYESLKSKGLELIENDSLRLAIISLYEFDYFILKGFEEDYHEMQFQENYFLTFNEFIADALVFNSNGDITGIQLPLRLSPKEKKIFLTHLWKIRENRQFLLRYYHQIEDRVKMLKHKIEEALK